MARSSTVSSSAPPCSARGGKPKVLLLWSPSKTAGSSLWALSACWRAATRPCAGVALALEKLRLPAESAFRV
jgi:hypothetical protein